MSDCFKRSHALAAMTAGIDRALACRMPAASVARLHAHQPPDPDRADCNRTRALHATVSHRPARRTLPPRAAPVSTAAPSTSAYQGYQIIRRNGAVVAFEPNKIAVALMKAFLAVHGTQGAASASVRETVDGLTEAVVRALLRSRPGGGTFHIEDVQDQVELGLMRGGHHEVARAYVLYRERRAQERAKQAQPAQPSPEPALTRHRPRPARAARHGAAAGADRIGLRRPGRRRQARTDPGRDAAQPVRRRADRRGAQGRRSWPRAR